MKYIPTEWNKLHLSINLNPEVIIKKRFPILLSGHVQEK